MSDAVAIEFWKNLPLIIGALTGLMGAIATILGVMLHRTNKRVERNKTETQEAVEQVSVKADETQVIAQQAASGAVEARQLSRETYEFITTDVFNAAVQQATPSGRMPLEPADPWK